MTPEQLRQYLIFYQDLGVKNIYRRAPAAKPAAQTAAVPEKPAVIEIWPLAPSGTMTRLATVCPVVKFRFDASGAPPPAGYTLR